MIETYAIMDIDFSSDSDSEYFNQLTEISTSNPDQADRLGTIVAVHEEHLAARAENESSTRQEWTVIRTTITLSTRAPPLRT